MTNEVTPALLNFILQLAMYGLIGFGITIAGAAAVYISMFRKGNFSGANIARILQQTDVPKLATIILIVLAANVASVVFAISSLHLLYLNTTLLPPALRPPMWRRVVLVAMSVFYGFFATLAARALF